jgi:protein AroM
VVYLGEDMETIGIITLGQTPRPDLEQVFRRHLPETNLLIRGGLDDVPAVEIDALAAAGGEYPLFVILRDGSHREISLYRLKPFLDRRAREVAAEGAAVSALMCAGNFPDLDSPIPMIYPSRILTAVARGICRGNRLGVITPNDGQVAAATAHWREKGFRPAVAVASPLDPEALSRAADALADPGLELIVLDCMGFPPAAARRMRTLCGRPVLCPQGLVPRVMAEMLGV